MSAADFVVTGAGVLCPVAPDLARFAEAARSDGKPVARIPFDFADRLTLHQSRRLDRLSQLIVVAASEAAARAQLEAMDGDRVGLVAGTALGCLEKTEAQLHGIARTGLDHADPMGFPDSMDNGPAAHAAIALGCRGASFTVTEREITGECATILAALLLRSGVVDAVVVAAGDAASPDMARVLPRFAPGLDAGEGAGALVLETAASAGRRGARVLGCLLGYGQASSEGKTGPLRFASRDSVSRAEDQARAMAGLPGNGTFLVEQDVLRKRIGWCMADGVLRAILGLTRFEAEPRAFLVSAGARGGAAAALLFGPPERER